MSHANWPPERPGCTRILYGCGFLDYREGSGGTVEIFDIHVDAEERQKGVGTRLLEILFTKIPKDARVWAITRADNRIAIEFYEHCRFRVVGVLRDFYREIWAVDAIMFGRLPGGPV